jgi:lipoyl-dependent peroxiredoxin
MRLIIRRASVRWKPGGARGTRTASTESGALNLTPFSSAVAHRRNSDTNSAELMAAAHAGSFSLALAHELGRAALSAGDFVTSSAVTLERLAAGWTIMGVHLSVVARLPKVTQGRFIDATVRAKTNCLVSRALRATISMNARLERRPSTKG